MGKVEQRSRDGSLSSTSGGLGSAEDLQGEMSGASEKAALMEDSWLGRCGRGSCFKRQQLYVKSEVPFVNIHQSN